MGANSGGVSELQAFLNVHPRRLYRQGAAGSIPNKAIRAALYPTRNEPPPELLAELRGVVKDPGLLLPLIVPPAPGLPHLFEVVVGQRPMRGARLAGLPQR